MGHDTQTCGECGKECKGLHGLMIHIARSHQTNGTAKKPRKKPAKTAPPPDHEEQVAAGQEVTITIPADDWAVLEARAFLDGRTPFELVDEIFDGRIGEMRDANVTAIIKAKRAALA